MRGELDVHPDDLLHRARGAEALSPEERAYVDAHLQDCGTCRFVLAAGRAFDAEATEPSSVKADRLAVDRLVARTLLRTGADRGGRRWRPGWSFWPSSRRRLAVAALGAALMLGGVAFAGYWGVRHPLQ
ncbi:MAG TPA: zf-HC2 domain-containing protein, partial [Polyangia bacterium]|nr:zf-HC2 domain-containing protein [Polyangia bacterium]